MFVTYNEKYNRESIGSCLEKQLYDEPVWYSNDYVTLEKDKDSYFVQMSVPANATGVSRYKRKWRLIFKEKGICVREQFTFFTIVSFFSIFVSGICMIGALLMKDWLWSFMAFVLFALFFGVFVLKAKHNIKDFLGKKMSN